MSVRVLLTNDDGVSAEGLQTLRRALAACAEVDLRVIAPDGNRSAIGRGITTRRALSVQRVRFDDGTSGYATDGTPVDCVRLAGLGLVDGWAPDLVVAGINHGSNLGDDVTYSGTVAAAMEGLMLGLPAVAVSQQSDAREMDFRQGEAFGFDVAARFTAGLVRELDRVPLPPSTLLNVNVPAGQPTGVEVARLGRRIYRDRLDPHDGTAPGGPREHPAEPLAGTDGPPQSFFIYGAEPDFENEPGTDLNAVHEGRIAVTPVHLDLTHHASLEALSTAGLQRLLA